MKITKVFLAGMLALGLAGCGGSSGGSSDEQSLTSTVFLTDDDSDYKEYIIVYSEQPSDKLLGIADEVHFTESAYFEYANNNPSEFMDIVMGVADSIYPGIADYDFADVSFNVEGDEYVCLLIKFSDLDNMDNANQLHDAEILSIDTSASYVKASEIEDSVEKNGGEKISLEDAKAAGLHVDY